VITKTPSEEPAALLTDTETGAGTAGTTTGWAAGTGGTGATCGFADGTTLGATAGVWTGGRATVGATRRCRPAIKE
jgi:hypothetical protein